MDHLAGGVHKLGSRIGGEESRPSNGDFSKLLFPLAWSLSAHRGAGPGMPGQADIWAGIEQKGSPNPKDGGSMKSGRWYVEYDCGNRDCVDGNRGHMSVDHCQREQL